MEWLEAFGHADEAEAFAPGRIDVETCPIVDDRQDEPLTVAAQMDRHFARLAVLGGVLQRFLSNPEQTQRQIVRKRRWDPVACERDGHVGPRELALQTAKRGD